jgi:hypothetical protein
MTSGSRIARLKSNGVIHRILEVLLAAKIPLCGFDGNMSEKKLDLFELAAILMAETGACFTEVMRGESDEFQECRDCAAHAVQSRHGLTCC